MKRFMKRKRRIVSSREDGIIAVKRVDMDGDDNHVMPTANELFDRNLSNHTKETKSYEKHKKEIYEEEYKVSWDTPARKSATPEELKAAEIIYKIREDERDNLFGNKASEAIPGPETLDMGGQFLTNRSRVEQKSRLYRIAREMPKGCHLHLHFNAELPPQMLLSKAKNMSNMFIRSTQPLLSRQDYDETEIVFEVKPVNTPTADIFSPDYKPEWKKPGTQPWMPWSIFQQEFCRRRREQNEKLCDAEDWVLSKMILSEDEVYNMDQTTNGYVL